MAVSATGPGKGGGVLERPVIEKTTPGRESEFDVRYKFRTSYVICILPFFQEQIPHNTLVYASFHHVEAATRIFICLKLLKY